MIRSVVPSGSDDGPSASDVAFAFAAAEGEHAMFLRVMRKAFPRFGLWFSAGGAA